MATEVVKSSDCLNWDEASFIPALFVVRAFAVNRATRSADAYSGGNTLERAVLCFGFVSRSQATCLDQCVNTLQKFKLEFLFEYPYQLFLNGVRKERWQIDKIKGGVTWADLECDILWVGCSVDDINDLPADGTAGPWDGDSVYTVFLNLHNPVRDDHDGLRVKGENMPEESALNHAWHWWQDKPSPLSR